MTKCDTLSRDDRAIFTLARELLVHLAHEHAVFSLALAPRLPIAGHHRVLRRERRFRVVVAHRTHRRRDRRAVLVAAVGADPPNACAASEVLLRVRPAEIAFLGAGLVGHDHLLEQQTFWMAAPATNMVMPQKIGLLYQRAPAASSARADCSPLIARSSCVCVSWSKLLCRDTAERSSAVCRAYNPFALVS